MATPTNTVTSQVQIGLREDLSDIISNVDPFETPWYSSVKKVKAKNTYSEWQTDTLAAPNGDNAHVEGDDTTAEAFSPTVRLGNYTQIFKKSCTVSGTDEGLDKAGRNREMAYQVNKKMKEIKTDIETAMFANQPRVAGDSVTARRMAGAGAWVATNVNNVGGGGSDPTGDGTDARTDGTETAFTQADFDLTMQEMWTEGGKPQVVYLAASQLQVAVDGFTGMNNQRSTIAASASGKNEVISAIDVYVTSFGRIEFVPSRHVRNQDVWIMQRDKWAIANLRPMKNTPLAKTGDSDKRQIVGECTLFSYNEKANGLVADCS